MGDLTGKQFITFSSIPSEFTVATSKHSFEIENFLIKPRKTTEIESHQIGIPEIDAYWWLTFGFTTCNDFVCKFTMEAKSTEIATQKYEYSVTFEPNISQQLINSFSTNFAIINQKTVTYRPIEVHENYCNHYLSQNGSLNLLVTVTIKGKGESSVKSKYHDRLAARSEIVATHGNMLDDPTFSDFTFDVKGKTFKVHRCILAAASPVFLKMFTVEMQESMKNECAVKDIEPNIFEHLLRFIYSGVLPENLDDLSMRLFEAAHFYEIDQLKTICLPEVHSKLSKETALELYSFSFLYELDDLKADAWKIIKRDVLKIFFPLKNEPLSPQEIQEILQQMEKEKGFWGKFYLEDRTKN